MTKTESRFAREVKTHCRFSENGYLTVRDKRRFPLIYKMLGKKLIDCSGYSENHINVKPI